MKREKKFLQVNIAAIAASSPARVERFERMALGAERQGRCKRFACGPTGGLMVFDLRDEEESADEMIASYVEQGMPRSYFKAHAAMPEAVRATGAPRLKRKLN